MTAPEKLQKLLSYFATNSGRLGKLIGKPQVFYDIKKGQIKSFSADLVAAIKKVYPEINEQWFLFDEGEMLNSSPPKPVTPEKEKIIHPRSQNAKQINEGEDFIWIETTKIPAKAGVQLSANYFAEAFINDLEKGKIMVSKNDIGKYWEIEASGEAMYDNSVRSIVDGDWYAALDVPRDDWRTELVEKQPYYFLLNEMKHITAEVISHDVNSGSIKLRYWNPDKSNFPDFEINIKDCYIVAEIKFLVKRNINTL